MQAANQQQPAGQQRRPNTLPYSSLYLNLPVYFTVVAVLIVFLSKTAVHQIPEGHVGLYWRGGRLLPRVTDPGMHAKLPFLDVYEPIQTTIQTDKITEVPCGTKGGINITFDRIEVVNRLKREYVYDTIKQYGIHYDRPWIYDKIHHEINQFCSTHTLQEIFIDMFSQVSENLRTELQLDCDKYAPGIEIIAVRVTKPRIPDAIMQNFVSMEVERTRALVATEHYKVIEREVETERRRAIAEAERNAETSSIVMRRKIQEKEAQKREQEIENEIFIARQRAQADADFYRLQREAEGYRLRLTPEYLEYVFIQSIANNTKMFFGEKVPTMILDQRMVTGVFDSLHQKQQQQRQRTARGEAADGPIAAAEEPPLLV